MKKILFVGLVIFGLFACKKKTPATTSVKEHTALEGEWDNFQQFWQQNTAEERHRVTVQQKHRHLHLSVSPISLDSVEMEIREGRNGKHLVEKIKMGKDLTTNQHLKLTGDTLYVQGMTHFENPEPYRFLRARTFSGWLELPLKAYPDSIYRVGDLEIHDQGGMAELQHEEGVYTAELTQLVYGKRLGIMKLAIYDMALDSVGINSRSISYAWMNPKAKRAGINLRKIISGWTLIEPGYQNQNTWRKEEN